MHKDSLVPEKEEKKVFTPEEFGQMYLALCKQTGFQISGVAGLKPMNDLGGYLTVVQLNVIPFVEQK